MLRTFFCLVVVCLYGLASAQQHSIGLGVHTGFTIPVSIDKGMNNDPRYNDRYTLKAAPIGIAFMKDFEGFGFVISPGLVTIGQNYDVVNTEGGHDGRRKINLRYATLPVAFKLHLIDLDFFRVSGVVSASVAYLFDAADQISHDNTKLKFPLETYPLLPEGYTVQYDGVLVPRIRKTSIGSAKSYNEIQLFAGVGLRSDWDVTNHWRVSFDFRVNYGLLEPRQETYLAEIEKYESIYDTPGSRKDIFAHFSFGISRFIDFDKGDKDREKKLKGSGKMYSPPKKSQPKSRGGRKR